MPKIIVKCDMCGKEFAVYPSRIKTGKGKHCSRECYLEYKKTLTGELNKKWKPKVQKKCLNCGKKFEIFPYEHEAGTGKYCSKKCHNIHSRGQNRPLRNSVTRICSYCGKEFIVPFYLTKDGGAIFCSNKCSYNHHVGTNHPLYKEKVIIECENCGVKFSVIPSRANKRETRFCSGGCRSAYTTKHMKKKETKIEIITADVLDQLGIEYEKQKIIGRYVTDFFIPSLGLVIECDGIYWHNRPGVREKDKRRDTYIKSCGYAVLRIWEPEIHKNALGIIKDYIDTVTSKNRNAK